MKKISYYDLLNMIKNNEYPSVYYHCSNGAKILYKPEFDDVDNSFLCYMLKNNKEYNEEYARHYLVENILECEMFKNNLEIVEDKPKEDKKIEKLGAFNIKKFYDDYPETAHFILEMFKKQEELIDKVNGDKNE